MCVCPLTGVFLLWSKSDYANEYIRVVDGDMTALKTPFFSKSDEVKSMSSTATTLTYSLTSHDIRRESDDAGLVDCVDEL